MARGRGLYHLITEPDNLRLAFKKAVKGKSDWLAMNRISKMACCRRESLPAGYRLWYHSPLPLMPPGSDAVSFCVRGCRPEGL